jgi:hypothetical protein
MKVLEIKAGTLYDGRKRGGLSVDWLAEMWHWEGFSALLFSLAVFPSGFSRSSKVSERALAVEMSDRSLVER